MLYYTMLYYTIAIPLQTTLDKTTQHYTTPYTHHSIEYHTIPYRAVPYALNHTMPSHTIRDNPRLYITLHYPILHHTLPLVFTVRDLGINLVHGSIARDLGVSDWGQLLFIVILLRPVHVIKFKRRRAIMRDNFFKLLKKKEQQLYNLNRVYNLDRAN